jgi:HEAT repeat protein
MKPDFQRLRDLRALHYSLLIEALKEDPSDVVRHEAAFVIGEWCERVSEQDRSDIRKEGMLALFRAAETDKSILVRHEAALALAQFRNAAALALLLRLTLDSASEVRSSACYAIEQMLLDDASKSAQ